MLKPQFQNKPAFCNILWQRPININQKRGRVLVLGGEKQIDKVLRFCEVLYFMQIKTIKLAYPDAMNKTYKEILPIEYHYPLKSSREKNLSITNYNVIKNDLDNFDIIVLGIGLSQNQETKELIKKLIGLKKPILFCDDVSLRQSDLLIKRATESIIFLDQNSVTLYLNKKILDLASSRQNTLENLSEIVNNTRNVILYQSPFNKQVSVIAQDKIIITDLANAEILIPTTAALWSQNIEKPLQSAATACFITKIWQENFTNPKDITKVIYKTENLCDKL